MRCTVLFFVLLTPVYGWQAKWNKCDILFKKLVLTDDLLRDTQRDISNLYNTAKECKNENRKHIIQKEIKNIKDFEDFLRTDIIQIKFYLSRC